ncbi:MAG: adenine-specific DNA-methyltransferase [Akkermansiaceae bacterium]|jgi:adenine-specific DNA-methyltransferase
MSRKQKLELTWIGKENRPKLEPRILLEDPEKSYHAPHRVGENDFFDNKLIFGDNLLALKALEQEHAGKVKCVFIDPPYNTGQAFEYYDDGLEHSVWLSLLRERIEILKKLLTQDGVIFCQLNDDEMAYGKVLMDEIMGRNNFLNQVSVKMKQTAGASGGGEDKRLKKNIEYILIYARDRDSDLGFKKFNEVYDEESLFDYIQEMRDAGKSWKYTRILKSPGTKSKLETIKDGSGEDIIIYKHEDVIMSPIRAVCDQENLTEEQCYAKYFDKIFRDTNAQSSIRTRVMEAVEGKGAFFSIEYTPRSGRNKGAMTTLLYKGQKCDLIAWLRDIAVKKGNRIVRLEKDKWDNWVISKDYNPTMLAEAVCKLEGFTYEPSVTHYWMHGHSTEQDFLYVTTANLKHAQLQQLSDEVGPERSLLVVCTSFRGSKEGYSNLTVKKVPKAVLNRCEWGKDDYSLRVENLPAAPPKEGQQDLL